MPEDMTDYYMQLREEERGQRGGIPDLPTPQPTADAPQITKRFLVLEDCNLHHPTSESAAMIEAERKARGNPGVGYSVYVSLCTVTAPHIPCEIVVHEADIPF